MDIVEMAQKAGEAARAAYAKIDDAHSEDYKSQFSLDDSERVVRCICGFTPRQDKSATRARGLHIAAQRRAADKAWHRTYDEVLAELKNKN